jgi:hypothetical protein
VSLPGGPDEMRGVPSVFYCTKNNTLHTCSVIVHVVATCTRSYDKNNSTYSNVEFCAHSQLWCLLSALLTPFDVVNEGIKRKE